MPLRWMWKPNISSGVGFSSKAVWSRASRRQEARGQNDTPEREDGDSETALGFKISLQEENPGAVSGVKVTVRWLKGHDAVLFESFCGMIKRKIEELQK